MEAARYRQTYPAIIVNLNVVAADDLATTGLLLVPAARNANWTNFIQRIIVVTTTDNAATITFRDNASTPVVIAKTKASPGIGVQDFDFGAAGVPITAAKGLSAVASAAGLAGQIHIEGYQRQTLTESI